MKTKAILARVQLPCLLGLAIAGGVATAPAQCLTQVILTKTMNFGQEACALPAPRPEAYSFVALAAGLVFGATVTAPGQAPVAMDSESQTPEGLPIFTTDLSGGNSYSNRLDLEQAWPAGNYVVRVDALFSVDSFTVPFTGEAYPNPPTVLNHAAGQHIAPGAEFRLEFEPFLQPGPNDLIQFSIATSPGQPNFVLQTNVAATNLTLTIPAWTLSADTTYSCALEFLRQTTNLIGTGSLSCANLGSGFAAATRFELHTLGSPASGACAPTQLSAALAPGGGACQVQFQAQPGCCYWIQGSSDLARWTSVYATNAVAGQVSYSVPLTHSAGWRFFRVFSQ